MAWITIAAGVLVDAFIALYLRRELPRWQNSEGLSALVAPLRVITGSLLMLLILLIAIGVAFVLPHSGTVAPPSATMVTYWLFSFLLVGLIVFLTLLDVVLVRQGFQRRREEMFSDVLLGQDQRQNGDQTEGTSTESH